MGGYGAYWFAIGISALVSLLVLRIGMRRAGLARGAFFGMALLSMAFGVLGARGYYLLAHDVIRGFAGSVPAMLSVYPYAYTLCGAVLGVLAAAALTARLAGCPAGRLLDAAAPAGLVMIALSRLAEYFADFGWGQAIMPEALRRFPFGVQDAFGEWHYAIFVLEALCALAVLGCTVRRREGRFARALALWAATQIVCESMRAETLRWGFVHVQQIQCALLMLAVLAWCGGRQDGELARWAVFACGVLAVAVMEYALDKWNWPRAACYAGMTAAAAGMAAAVCTAMDTGKELFQDEGDSGRNFDGAASERDSLRADGNGLRADGAEHGAANRRGRCGRCAGAGRAS